MQLSKTLLSIVLNSNWHSKISTKHMVHLVLAAAAFSLNLFMIRMAVRHLQC